MHSKLQGPPPQELPPPVNQKEVWFEHVTTDGKQYYSNPQTHQTSWERPQDVQIIAPPAPGTGCYGNDYFCLVCVRVCVRLRENLSNPFHRSFSHSPITSGPIPIPATTSAAHSSFIRPSPISAHQGVVRVQDRRGQDILLQQDYEAVCLGETPGRGPCDATPTSLQHSTHCRTR